ncbi:thioredoxin [symbiont of Argiope bruennichi]|uniref:thioredoxin n=1 Tax=symbiont of Argiope bruennichi TaxID=2810479 RepID=UPI003DA43D29
MKIAHSIDEFKNILNENKLVIVDFYADWCGPCKMLLPVLEEVSKEKPEICFVKVNVDDFRDLAKQYNVASIPDVFFLKNQEIVFHFVGFRPKSEIFDLIKEHLNV